MAACLVDTPEGFRRFFNRYSGLTLADHSFRFVQTTFHYFPPARAPTCKRYSSIRNRLVARSQGHRKCMFVQAKGRRKDRHGRNGICPIVGAGYTLIFDLAHLLTGGQSHPSPSHLLPGYSSATWPSLMWWGQGRSRVGRGRSSSPLESPDL